MSACTSWVMSAPSDDVVKELCVCGQVAEYDCARCETKGYCSEECQESDYKQHKKLCRRIRRQRKEDKRKQKLLMEPPVRNRTDLIM